MTPLQATAPARVSSAGPAWPRALSSDPAAAQLAHAGHAVHAGHAAHAGGHAGEGAADGARAVGSADLSGVPAAARRALALLARLPHGRLSLTLPDGRALQLPAQAAAASPELTASLHLRDWSVLALVQREGDIGLAEAYIDGRWHTPDLAALLRLCIANRNHLEQLVYGSWWGGLWHRLRHLRHRNSRAGSARNIHAHYDLGNAFYRLWLDETMNYSAAWFEGRGAAERAEVPLAQAQQAKMRRALDELRLQPGQRLLEIGCGWGAVAELAAAERGLQVTGVTLSREQLAWGQQRLQAAGLAPQAELRYQDYRDLPAACAGAPYDAVVSIEMFEAVGEAYWAGYFDTLRRCLKPGGRACIQTITIRDELFKRYRRGTDFIQQYIFPGGLLPSPSAFEAAARRAGFEVEQRLAFGPDYAETLRRWHRRFALAREQVLAQGFDQRFLRTWGFYLAYCEAAFDMGNTDVIQFTLRKPG